MLVEKPLEKNLCHNCYYKFVTNTFRCRLHNNIPCKDVIVCNDVYTKRFTYRLEDQNGNPSEEVIITPELRYSSLFNDNDNLFKEILRKLAYYEEKEWY